MLVAWTAATGRNHVWPEIYIYINNHLFLALLRPSTPSAVADATADSTRDYAGLLI